ncbi:MAG: hypothetical protein ACLUVY_15025 [Bacteroides uniformis]
MCCDAAVRDHPQADAARAASPSVGICMGNQLLSKAGWRHDL